LQKFFSCEAREYISAHFMEQRTSAEKLFLTGMILSMTCWGFSWVSAKVLSAYGPPLTLAFFRFALTFASMPLMFPVVKVRLAIDRKGLPDLLVASVIMSLYTFLFFKGLTEGKAGAGGVLVTVLNPVIAYGIMLLLTRRKPSQKETIGLIVGLLAGAILLRVTSEPRQVFAAGNIYFLLSAFAWAALSHFTARASRYGSPVSFSFWVYGISTLVLFLFTGSQSAAAMIDQADVTFWVNLFFISTITAGLATTFYFVATSKIGASKAASFIFMVPFSAALGSWIFLGEAIEAHTIIGGLLGIIAVYILNRKEN
jgi:drug/metabolite transporter (DMT)-like permease